MVETVPQSLIFDICTCAMKIGEDNKKHQRHDSPIELVNVGPEIFKLQWLLMNFLRQNLVSGSRWFDIWDKHLRGNFRENSSGLFMDGKDIEIYWNIGDNSRAIHNNMEIYQYFHGEVELGHSKNSQCKLVSSESWSNLGSPQGVNSPGRWSQNDQRNYRYTKHINIQHYPISAILLDKFSNLPII